MRKSERRVMAFQSSETRWQPPDGLTYSGPRSVRLSGQGIAMVCLAGVFVLLAATIGPMAYHAIHGRIERDRLLRQQGVAASGAVKRLWKESDKNATPMVSYRFAAPGGEFTGQSDIRSETWRGLHPDDPLTVRYLPARPEVNQPAEGVPGPPPEWLAWMPLLMFFWPPLLFWFLVSSQRRLLVDGVPVQAVVARITRTKQISVQYEFKTPAGEPVKGRSQVSRRNVPEVGAQICVLYNPDNPRKNSVYPLDMVKLRKD